MSKLHIFVDGSWLFKTCEEGRALGRFVEHTRAHVEKEPFELDFSKLTAALLEHVAAHDPACTEVGDRKFCTCIFEMPDDLDTLAAKGNFTKDDIAAVSSGVRRRETFRHDALQAGFSEECIRPVLTERILREFLDWTYREKKVDGTVITWAVQSASENPHDYHCIVTGDADYLPALGGERPSRHVFVATTDPSQSSTKARQAAFELVAFPSDIAPFLLDHHPARLLAGEYVYRCAACQKTVFSRKVPIRLHSEPCCRSCFDAKRRTA